MFVTNAITFDYSIIWICFSSDEVLHYAEEGLDFWVNDINIILQSVTGQFVAWTIRCKTIRRRTIRRMHRKEKN